MSIRRDEFKIQVSSRISWDELMGMLSVVDDIDYANYQLKDAMVLEGYADHIRKVIEERDARAEGSKS